MLLVGKYRFGRYSPQSRYSWGTPPKNWASTDYEGNFAS